MEQKGVCSSRHWQVMGLFFVSILKLASAQLRYSLLEESEPGTLVGNVAKDLGLNTAGISERALRLGSEQSQQYFSLNLESGAIIVRSRIDREKLCGTNVNCVLPVEIVLEKPLELYRLEIEILDTNDHSPVFQNAERTIKITELAAVGTRFPLERAQDPDLGINSVSSYKLSHNKYFSLNVQARKNERPSPVLVLDKALDREEQAEYKLVLTALDGGSTPRSGTIVITVIVIDNNDNAPVFDNTFYKISLKENAQLNTLVIRLNATDKDDGSNGEVSYTFEDISSEDISNVFSLEHKTGDIRLKGPLDFEKHHSYEISVKAVDHGIPEMEGHCVIQVDIEDVNDNSPEILISSLVSSIPEDTPPGTTVGLLRVSDQDSGKNGEVHLEISPDLPFTITSTQNHYSLVTDGFLDREHASQYTIVLQATDLGDPQLKTQTALNISVTDINDNPPRFERSVINVDIKENNKPGALLCTVSASDKDFGENAHITYSIFNSLINGSPAMSFIYMDTQNGNIYAQQSFDYEQAQVLQFTIRAEDSGTPKLSSNCTVYLHILDENDNQPSILYPGSSRQVSAQQPLPRSLPAGSLITKVVAIDADSGYNAWLNYNIAKATDLSLFKVSSHTGEVRLARSFQETDLQVQNLCIVVKDNGTPSLSSTATLLISLGDGSSEESHYSTDLQSEAKQSPNVTMYLIISLAAISVVSFVTLIILLTKCFRNKQQMTNSEMNHYIGHTQKTLQLNPTSTLRYMEVSMMPGSQQNQYPKTGGSSDINRDTLNMMKSLNFPQLKQLVNESDDVISGQFEWRDTAQQGQPNTDWRFSQAQRPGPSGAQQPTEEAGVWPNNQFETERLQAMILASANVEAAEGSSAIGAGTGTMGLSARYGPQFTLQHVPDYRQNIYIPGTTSTLTNAAGKRDGKAGAPSGNKKKSGKKEKK
ncbi:protocadherin gamma-C5-like isoform X21 [Rhinoderma darwinii]|uniref:protocadherin gamma-C5-like isoform X21 n=1 Tax=Rhinoderma darwinii TaxID=43563 RepID=UPI003F67CB9F